MVPGVPGLTGLHVPSPVEEQKPDGDCVTVQPLPRVVQTVRGRDLSRGNVGLTPVQVNTLLMQ